MMLPFTTTEHKEIPVTAAGGATSLSRSEADVLLKLNAGRPGFCDRRSGAVRLAQYCGVVNLGQRVLEIVPKVGEHEGDVVGGRGVLLRLLRASPAHSGFRSIPATQQVLRLPLLEIFISAYMDAATAIVRGGLLRQYQERQDDLRVVRGRIVAQRQFSVLFNRTDVIASRYDDHTADNVWNRSMKAALRAVRPWIVSGDLHRRWVELMAAMEDVSDVHVRISDVDKLVFDRQAKRYAAVMLWVKWILSLLSPAIRAGEQTAPAFLFDMNRVFENVVTSVLRRRLADLRPGLIVSAQVHGRFLARLQDGSGRNVFELRPDITIGSGTVVQLIADAKWKRLKVTRSGHVKPSRSDMYQMNAYAAAFGVERLVLIYPAHSGAHETSAPSFVLRGPAGSQPVVSVACMDVSRDDLPFVFGAGSLFDQYLPSDA